MGAPAQILLALPRSRQLWAQLFWYCRGLGGFGRSFFGIGTVSAALAQLFWYCRDFGGFGAAFLVLPRSRRLWAQLFWYYRGLDGFGGAFLMLPRSRQLWRSFFGIGAISAASGAAFLVLARLHWLTASIGSREKNIAAKIQPHLQKFCVQDDLCHGAAVLNKLRLPYKKKQAVQPPVRFFSQTAPATVCRPPDSLAPQKRRQTECSAAPVCFFLPRRKSGGRLNVQHSLRRSPLGR